MATIRWTGRNGDWATAADWSLGRLPGAADRVRIDTPRRRTVTHGSGDDVVQTLRVGGEDDFIVAGGSLQVTGRANFGHLLITGGTLALGGRSTAESLIQSGSLAGAGNITIGGVAHLQGLQTGAGVTFLRGDSTVTDLGLDGGRTLENQGTLILTQYAEIDLGVNPFGESIGGATLRNGVDGVINIQGANHIGFVETLPTGSVHFTNAGTLKKTVAAGPAFVDVALSNAGTIQVEAGVLEFDTGLTNRGSGTASVAAGATLRVGGGGSSRAAAFTVSAGGTLQFAGHIFAAGGDVFTLGAGTLGGSGTVAVTGGELALGAGAVTFASFAQGNATQSNCTVSGSGTLTVTGAAAFTGGAMRQTGPGVTRLEGTSTLAGNVVGGLFLEGGRVLENQGTFTIFSGLIELGGGAGGATLRNDAGGTIDLQGVAIVGQGGGVDILINDGMLEKSAGAGPAIVGVAVVNTGAIVARAFALDFAGTITGDGNLVVEAGATLEVDSGAAASLSMAFKAGGGTLALHHAGAFAATIHGFAGGDAIDLLGRKADRAVLESGDNLAIFQGSARLATLHLAGDYTGATFGVASDGAGGTSVTVTGLGATNTMPFISAMAAFGARTGALMPMVHEGRCVPAAMVCVPRTAIA